MTISLISTGEHLDYYNRARKFFSDKGISYKYNGPFTYEQVIKFNLPLTNSDKGFIPNHSPLYNYTSDFIKWLNDINDCSGTKGMSYFPYCGLIILFGEQGLKVKDFLSKLSFDSNSKELHNRVFIITDEKNFDDSLIEVYNNCLLYWAKWENMTLK